MREFSSKPHGALMGRCHDSGVTQDRIPRASLAILVVAVSVCGVVVGAIAASRGIGAPSSSPVAVSTTPSPTPAASMALTDVVGEDLARLPRYPDSVRSGFEIVREDHFRLTATEYHADATVDDVRTFYQGVIVEHGWDRADINFERGEWTYVLVDGAIEALIEIEALGDGVEIDLQISEPIATPAPAKPDPTPTQAPTPMPVAPPPPPPPPSDHDDDDGDDGDDDSGDGGDGSDDG